MHDRLPPPLDAIEASLRARHPLPLPGLADLPSGSLVRLLYRRALAERGDGFPLVRLVQPTDAAALADAVGQAAGGWLALGARLASAGHRIDNACRSLGVLLLEESDATVAIPPELAARIRSDDVHHLLAVDPALAPIRAALLAHCRGTGIVHLVGEPGTGKRTLAMWVHRALGEGPLAELSHHQTARPEVGSWLLINELGELTPSQSALVEQRLAQRIPAREVTRGADAPPRPTDRAFDELIGESAAIRDLLSNAARVAKSAYPVLIVGESGTGKEVLARALHAASGRAGPYVPIDLSAVPEELVESELFGHVRGAFTGAERPRMGAFRSAAGGTLLIDELGNLRPSVQARLLRVLQERRVRPVGSDTSEPVDVRVIAATNADLHAMVAAGRFREDLLMRLETFKLHLPPLRERRDDILLIAGAIFARDQGLAIAPPRWLDHDAEAALVAWRWPGNVRELESVVRRVSVLARPGRPLPLTALGLPGPRAELSPILSTHSGPPIEDPVSLGLSRQSFHTLTALTLRVPALRDRSVEARRALLLLLLDGTPIRTSALGLLAAQPWWGNLTELRAAVAALRTSGGVIDEASVRTALPHLAGVTGHRPIMLLLNPVIDEGGSTVRGLHEEFDAGILVIGRVRTLGALTDLAQQDPGRYAPVIERLQGKVPAFLDLSLLPTSRMSRVQALIGRDEHGLTVEALHRSNLRVWAGPLGADAGPVRMVLPSEPLSIGGAGELQLRDPSGALFLRCFVFAGVIARDEHASHAAARVANEVQVATAFGTEHPTSVPMASQVPDPKEPRLRWVLTAAETEATLLLLLSFPGGQFKAWLNSKLDSMRTQPSLGRLASFIQHAPNPGDYLGRLLEYEGNEGALATFREAYAAAPDHGALRARLPVRLQRLLVS